MEIKTLGQLINHLATKAGVKADDPNLVNILSNAEISKIPIHSDLVQSIDENLLNIEAALDQHPRVRAKYTAEVLNPFDTRLNALLEEVGLDDAGKEEYGKIKSTYRKFEWMTAKLKELKDAKHTATKDKDKEALQQQIDQLQNDLKVSKKAIDDAKTEYETKLQEDRKDFRLRNLIAGKKTTLDTLPEDVRNSTILGIINKNLQAQDAELRFDEKGELQPYKKDGSKLYGANHTQITLDSLIDSELAQNKLLPVTNTATQSGGGNGQQQHQQQHQQSSTTTVDGNNGHSINGTNQSVANYNLAALASLGEAAKQ